MKRIARITEGPLAGERRLFRYLHLAMSRTAQDKNHTTKHHEQETHFHT